MWLPPRRQRKELTHLIVWVVITSVFLSPLNLSRSRVCVCVCSRYPLQIARANLISPYAKAGASTEEALVYGVGGAVLGWVVLCGAFFVFAIIRKRRDAVGDEAVPLTAQSSTEPNTYDS